MSAQRTERLLNLVICLLATRRWLTKQQIRAAVPQYAGCESDEAFDRMFERDKEDLRELGIPLTTGTDSTWFDDELGYRIDREAYALPPLHLEPDELAVLSLASRVWQQASLAGPASRALVKLRATGVELDDSSLVGIEPRVRTSEPAFQALYAATRDRSPVRFTYRTASTGEVAVREVEPWSITSWHGRWYLVGRDRLRDAPRVFRLSRVEGSVTRAGSRGTYEIPDGLDPRSLVAGQVREAPERMATLRLRAGAGQVLRRWARGPARAVDDGWDEVQLAFTDVELLAEEVASHGPTVVAQDPPDLRQAVVRRLRGVTQQVGVAS